jgi:hypothetical protein
MIIGDSLYNIRQLKNQHNAIMKIESKKPLLSFMAQYGGKTDDFHKLIFASRRKKGLYSSFP